MKQFYAVGFLLGPILHFLLREQYSHFGVEELPQTLNHCVDFVVFEMLFDFLELGVHHFQSV